MRSDSIFHAKKENFNFFDIDILRLSISCDGFDEKAKATSENEHTIYVEKNLNVTLSILTDFQGLSE